jgi:hypothetical protein
VFWRAGRDVAVAVVGDVWRVGVREGTYPAVAAGGVHLRKGGALVVSIRGFLVAVEGAGRLVGGHGAWHYRELVWISPNGGG